MGEAALGSVQSTASSTCCTPLVRGQSSAKPRKSSSVANWHARNKAARILFRRSIGTTKPSGKLNASRKGERGCPLEQAQGRRGNKDIGGNLQIRAIGKIPAGNMASQTLAIASLLSRRNHYVQRRILRKLEGAQIKGRKHLVINKPRICRNFRGTLKMRGVRTVEYALGGCMSQKDRHR